VADSRGAGRLPHGTYREHDRQRRLPENHANRRSDFARDRARLLHSSALRRLAAKTQVVSPTSGAGFARNRLTHSLEVAQVGREIAVSFGVEADIVDSACLAHDLGHPPFGHNGEQALNEFARGIGGFEGNAQTLRLLARLEPKVFDTEGTPYGLNLTRAILDASCKYPWPADPIALERGERVKFGYYDDDEAAFAWLRAGAPGTRRCFEAQIMDLSDDIAYSVHDFEDAIFGGYIDVAVLGTRDEDGLVAAIRAWVGETFENDDLREALRRLRRLDVWVHAWNGGRLAQAHLKNLTSQLIGRFAGAAVAATRQAHLASNLTRYNADVVVPRQVRAEIAVLKGIVATFVMSSDTRQPLYARQRELILELCQVLTATGPDHLDAGFAEDWRAAADDAARRRVVIDQVANLTDQAALSWAERLVRG
jgi:dGTPase